jgi:hypothetical protein
VPVIAIEQKTTSKVRGLLWELSLKYMISCVCYAAQMPIVTIREKMVSYSDEQIKDLIIDDFTENESIFLLRFQSEKGALRNCSSKSLTRLLKVREW